jgi:hypothetical protein
MGKNDTAWEALFDKYNILSEISSTGRFKISASQIKEYREPRLMTKFDHRENLPEIFKQYNLAILPISRGDYLISSFYAYEDLCSLDDMQPIPIRVPDYLQTLIPKYIVSEAIALNFADAAGILSNFLDDDELASTVNGRMGSNCFDFYIGSNIGNQLVSVNNSQVEIDAAYEGLNYLSLLEAKRDMSSTDFLIRQLYYPYRLWMNRVSKQVKTVFFIYSNGDFRLYEYLFNEPEYYNSLQLVKCQRYVIAAGITLTDIQNIIYNIQIEAEPEIPFPQADSMTRVVNLLELLFGNDMSKQDITANYGFDERQTNYYTAAGKYLGLIENYQNQNTKEIVFSLTPLARKILSSSYREKQLELIKCILQHKVFNDVMKAYLLCGEMPERSHIINLMKKDSLYNVNSDSTYSRRASTVSGWLNWIVSLCELE